MTHSGGKPHAVGDKGQRYQVLYWDGDGHLHIFGWTDAPDGGRLAIALSHHPVWKLADVIDRRPYPKDDTLAEGPPSRMLEWLKFLDVNASDPSK